MRMGRLFWKFFLAFWLALLVAGVGVGLALRWQAENARETARERAEQSQQGMRGQFLLDNAAAALEYGGIEALRGWRGERRRPRMLTLLVFDEAGRELFDREFTADELARARQLAASSGETTPARLVTGADGRAYLLYARAEPGFARGRAPRPAPLPVWVPLGIGLFASLAFGALLAWYLTRPARYLREAFDALARGRLDTRVATRIGRRRDEIADLGRDFDHMAQRLQQLVDAQRRLLHDVSHELRSPLARMQVAVGLARQDPARLDAALDRVELEAARLDELVGGLLTLARLEADTDSAPKVAVDLTELVAGVVDDARYEARAADREVAFDGALEASVDGWPEALQRAIENVVRNAVKFTAPGSVVEVAVRAGRPGFALVSVADRGPGVDDAGLAVMFEPFRRVGGGEAPGFGLGLAIARRAARAHGGDITARRRDGGGLVVEIELPATGSAPLSPGSA